MDYKQLLLKYMQLLDEVEGSVFLELANSPFNSSVCFSEDEMKALRKLEESIGQTV